MSKKPITEYKTSKLIYQLSQNSKRQRDGKAQLEIALKTEIEAILL